MRAFGDRAANRLVVTAGEIAGRRGDAARRERCAVELIAAALRRRSRAMVVTMAESNRVLFRRCSIGQRS
jgi:hypothetical protein